MSEPSIQNNQRDFRCAHCSGRIMIPKDLPPTTGPCPHCGGIITSPALQVDLPPAPSFSMPAAPPVAQAPAPLTASMPSPAAIPQPAVKVIETPPTPAPVQSRTVIPAKRVPEEEPPPVPIRAQGNLAPPQDKLMEKDRRDLKQTPEKPDKKSILVPLLTVFLLLVALGAAGVCFAPYLQKEFEKTSISPPLVQSKEKSPLAEAQYLRIGWQKDARATLEKFMAAVTAKEKLPYIINGPQLAETVDSFYGGTKINDSDTPAETFSAYELSEEDKKRGIFMMAYDQPPQFDMKEFFRPLAPLEVQYGLDEADLLLSTVALVGNFAMEPLRVHAFFKLGPDGMKLDWETFVQTKYRTFETFVSLPEQNLKGVFRVLILEDVPEQGRAEQGTRTYRLIDPANKGDTARVTVKVDSDVGRTLSPINWRGTKESRPNTKTATLELRWAGDENNPQLTISRFICWEFLGLGGDPTAKPVAPK